MAKVTDTLEAAIGVLKASIKYGPTHGADLAAYQLIQQACDELKKQEKAYDLVKKVQRI